MADTFASFPVNRRIPEIDYLRGFAMLCIVLGHAVMLLPRAFDYHAYTLSHLLVVSVYSFHLEILFFVAGFCYTCSDYKSFIGKKCRHILLPYIFFGLAQVLYLYGVKAYLTNGSSTLVAGIYEFLLCGGKYWFLYTIFIMFLVYPLLEKLCPRKIFLVLGFVFLEVFFTYPDIVTLPKLMYFFIYFSIGNYLAQSNYKQRIFNATPKQKKAVLLGSLCVLLVAVAGIYGWGIHPVFRILRGISLVAGIGALVLLFPFYKMTNFIGRMCGNLLIACSIFSLQLYLFDGWWQGVFCLALPIEPPYILSPLLFVLDVGLSLVICKYILPKSAFLRYVCGVMPTRFKPLTD